MNARMSADMSRLLIGAVYEGPFGNGDFAGTVTDFACSTELVPREPRLSFTSWQRNPKAARCAGARRDHRVAAVQARDLPYQSEAEPRSRRVRADPVERKEHPLALGFWNAFTDIRDTQYGEFMLRPHLDPHRKFAVATSILEQIANETAQQAGVAPDGNRLTLRSAVIMRAFLNGEREQIDLLAGPLPTLPRKRGEARMGELGIEPARQQNFLDQEIEFGDIAFELRLVLRIALLLEQLNPEPDARKRRPQLVRGIGQQHAMSIDQFLDARGRAVEL